MPKNTKYRHSSNVTSNEGKGKIVKFQVRLIALIKLPQNMELPPDIIKMKLKKKKRKMLALTPDNFSSQTRSVSDDPLKTVIILKSV